jgi:hypothetical protein
MIMVDEDPVDELEEEPAAADEGGQRRDDLAPPEYADEPA